MSTHPGCNQFKHAPGCGHPGATGGPAEAAGVDLTAPVCVEDICADPEFVECMSVWDATDEPDSHLMDAVAGWGERLLGASEEDRPGYDRLANALDYWADLDEHDLDAAIDVVESIDGITATLNMDVRQDADGNYWRTDGKPGHACPDCGNGYATGRVLQMHREQDCTGALAAEDSAQDADAHDVLHSAADSYASAVNNAGRAAQVDFLRANGWKDRDIKDAVLDVDPEDWDSALDDMVIDAASHAASQAYNDGEDDGEEVTRALDADLYDSAKEMAAVRDGRAPARAWGERIDAATDALGWFLRGEEEN